MNKAQIVAMLNSILAPTDTESQTVDAAVTPKQQTEENNMDFEAYERSMVQQFGRTVTRLLNDKDATFADVLTAELQNSPKTIASVAAEIKTSSTSINKWKAGKSYPAAHYLYRLAIALHSNLWQTALIVWIRKIDTER